MQRRQQHKQAGNKNVQGIWIQIENEMSFNEASTDAVSEAHRHAWLHGK